ncbi:MAG: insulinase family protein [Cyclobacteriaceae bacterium]|nr:insulinase family protein [Cyclobacteriaceae bacterium]
MLDRSVAPPFTRTLDFQLPSAVQFGANGSASGWVIHSNEHPVCKVELVLSAGKRYESVTGASHFAGQLLDKGTKYHSALEIASHLDHFGAHLDIETGSDYLHVNLYALSQHLQEVLPLLQELMEQPSFPDEEWRIAKDIFAQNLQVNLEKTAFLAARGLRKLLFPNHPYGTSVQLEDLNRLDPTQISGFYQMHRGVDRIFVAGSVNDNDLQSLQKLLTSSNTTPRKDPSFSIQAGTHQHILRKDSLQASIRMGKLGVDRMHKDYAGILLTNHILGGYFGSRLMKNIREEKGLSYGIYSTIQHHALASTMSIGADVNRAQMDLAIAEIQREMVALQKIEQDELTTARNHFIGSLQNDISNVFAATERIKMMNLEGLPAGYFQQLIHSLESISTDDVAQIAEVHFDPAQFVIVTAG